MAESKTSTGTIVGAETVAKESIVTFYLGGEKVILDIVNQISAAITDWTVSDEQVRTILDMFDAKMFTDASNLRLIKAMYEYHRFDLAYCWQFRADVWMPRSEPVHTIAGGVIRAIRNGKTFTKKIQFKGTYDRSVNCACESIDLSAGRQ